MLRSRSARREDLTDEVPEDSALAGPSLPRPAGDPEEEALLAESVSQALLLVLDTLEPAERIALVLHDMFAVPFDQIAPIVERTPATTKKLASRARHKVHGTPAVPAAALTRQRRVVSRFLAAARAGDLDGVLAVLDPDVVRTADAAALPPGAPAVRRGARAVAEGTVLLAARSRWAELALVNGEVGVIVVLGGQLRFALTFTVDSAADLAVDSGADLSAGSAANSAVGLGAGSAGGLAVEGDKITGYTVIAAPERLSRLSLAVLE
jgi:RNA polymerase sigma-70 factor (ECF subfamily)